MSQNSGPRGKLILLLGTLAFILACSLLDTPVDVQPTFDATKAALESQSTALALQLTQAAQAAQNVQSVASPTEQPHLGPPPTLAPPPTEVQQRFFTEEFEAEVGNWTTFLTRGDINNLEQYVEDGSWNLELKARQMYVYSLYEPETYADVRIDIRAENLGDNTNNISAICRYDEDLGWYEFNMYNSGLYNIFYARWKSSRTQASYLLIADGGSNAIHQGKAVNDYTVICKGNTLSLFINGEETKTITQNMYTLSEGQVGIGVSSFDRLPIRVDFDSVRISEP